MAIKNTLQSLFHKHFQSYPGMYQNEVFIYFSSKVQARAAFAMYLVRVQQRLITETTPMSSDDTDALNEQMVSFDVHSLNNVMGYAGFVLVAGR